MKIFHIPGLTKATCYKPGWVEGLVAAGTVDGDTLKVEVSAYASHLAKFDGNPMLDPAARAAIAAQIAAMGVPCCGN